MICLHPARFRLVPKSVVGLRQCSELVDTQRQGHLSNSLTPLTKDKMADHREEWSSGVRMTDFLVSDCSYVYLSRNHSVACTWCAEDWLIISSASPETQSCILYTRLVSIFDSALFFLWLSEVLKVLDVRRGHPTIDSCIEACRVLGNLTRHKLSRELLFKEDGRF